MKGDPVLASREYIERGLKSRIVVFGGLHYMRGNKLPYFSLTCEYGTLSELIRGDGSGGSAHEAIHGHFGPRFDDLASLHLSGIDGTPMFALENGLFGFYDDGGYKGTKPTWEKRRKMLSKHFRVPEAVVDDVLVPLMGDGYSKHAGIFMQGKERAKAALADWIDQQKPIWKSQADECIAKHGLVVFGDEWDGATVRA